MNPDAGKDKKYKFKKNKQNKVELEASLQTKVKNQSVL